MRRARSADGPGFVVAVVLSLSLGIGLNSAIFTVLNALMLAIAAGPESSGAVPGAAAGRRCCRNVQKRLAVFVSGVRGASTGGARRHVGCHEPDRPDVQRGCSGETRTISVQLVSAGFFPMLGVAPVRGRLLADADNQQVGGHPSP